MNETPMVGGKFRNRLDGNKVRRSRGVGVGRSGARAVAGIAVAGAASACSFFAKAPVESPALIAARQTEDARILREVEARLSAEPSIGAGRVRVSVQAGEVTLFGGVAGFGALQCAERNAGLVRGVRLVIDQLVLEPGPRGVRCLAPRAAPATAGTTTE
jgi:osmotically-inducible protein OsmY